MQALVEPSGRIAQIVADGEEFPIHPDLQWIDAPAGVTTGHTWDGTQFVAPPAPPPEVPAALKASELFEMLKAKFPGQITDLDLPARLRGPEGS